jgi:hypothetical protein
MLDGKLQVLLGHAGAPARPTEAMVAVADQLTRQVDDALTRLSALLQGRVQEFNQLVRRIQAPAVAPQRPMSAGLQAAAAAQMGNSIEGGEVS